ncbi:MAG: hypothetical protein H0U39_12075, partial [Segetibacter sp.]|nr:hypothetical protein [Segetibacter sp.]
LHNINFGPQNDKYDELVRLLLQSDVDISDINILKNESDTIVARNLERNQLLVDRLNKADKDERKKYKVFRRETPFISSRIAGSTPDWAIGASPEFSFGPFSGLDGRNFWFDFFMYTRLVSVYISGDLAPVMMLPLRISIFARSPNTFTVTAGSIWIRADLLAAGLSKTNYTGLKVKGGKLTFGAGHKVEDDKITLSSTEAFNIQLDLDNSYTKTGTSINGIDAREADINLPVSIAMHYASGKFSLTELAASKWNLYGEERNFEWNKTSPVTYNGYLKRIVIPLTTDKNVCEIAACKSEFFDFSGSAKVLSSGWCLNVNVMDVTKPFEVKGNGALAILCTQGLLAKWQGLENITPSVKFNLPLIIAEPGKISVSDLTGNFSLITETYKLWKRSTDSDIRTTAELFFRNNKPFNYYSDEAGVEAISAFTDCKFQTDKPYRADGLSVSPETIDSFYLKYTTDAVSAMMVYDPDMILQSDPSFNHLKKPEIFEFAIKNAYFITTPPASLMLAGTFDKTNLLTKAQLNIGYGLFNLTPTLPDPYTSNERIAQYGISAEQLKNIREIKQWFPLLKNYLLSKCTWEEGVSVPQGTVEVDFDLLTDLFRQLNNLPWGEDADNNQLKELLAEDFLEDQSLLNGITNNDVYGRYLFSLLDVSTNLDLLGVNMVWNSRRFRA